MADSRTGYSRPTPVASYSADTRTPTMAAGTLSPDIMSTPTGVVSRFKDMLAESAGPVKKPEAASGPSAADPRPG